MDDLERTVGAAQPTGNRDEEKCPAVSAAGGSQRRTEGAEERVQAAIEARRNALQRAQIELAARTP